MGLLTDAFKTQQTNIRDSILPIAAKNEIMAGRLPQINTDSLFIKKGEKCVYIDKAILNVHKKKKVRRYVGHSAPGLFKGTRVHMSRPIETEYEDTEQFKGILYITNKRVVFQAKENAFDKQHRYLSAIVPYSNAVILQYGQKNFELIVSDGSVVYQALKLINEED